MRIKQNLLASTQFGAKVPIRWRRRVVLCIVAACCLLRAQNGVNGWCHIVIPMGQSSHPRKKLSNHFQLISTLHVTTQPEISSSASGDRTPRKNKNYKNRNNVKSMFQEAKRMERQGQWNEATALYMNILEKKPKDAHSHLALARLEARREKRGQGIGKDVKTQAAIAFEEGSRQCPESVHIWQAWAVYEQSRGDTEKAKELFEEALKIDPQNPYVCHAFGLYYKKLGKTTKAIELFQCALESESTAALVCSLGELLVDQGKFEEARRVYSENREKLSREKDRIEVFLASAWLEERCFNDFELAKVFLFEALKLNPDNSLANVAMARLEGRINQTSGSDTRATAKRLADACRQIEKRKKKPSDPSDGRIFNALAKIEVRARKFRKARETLKRGVRLYPLDHNVSDPSTINFAAYNTWLFSLRRFYLSRDKKLLQAAGKVEERMGNYTAARRLYGESLRLEPSAAALVSYALLEYRHPHKGRIDLDHVRGLFEEAMLLDPRHGPVYNAYGNIEVQSGEIERARTVFQRGVAAGCSDAASVYHGYGKLELALGNVETARLILERGLEKVKAKAATTDSTHTERGKFLSHTLGILELNSNRPAIALEIFQHGIHRCGNSSRLLLGAALSEMKLGKEDAARSLFERSVSVDKKHAQAWQAWGVMETKAGNFKQASSLFQCGLKSCPSHGALWHGYAALEIKKDNIQNARVLYAAGIQKAPNHISLYQGWALLELRQGKYEDAKKLITEALTRNKKNGSGWLIAAQIEEEQGNDGLVSLLLRRGIECAPGDPELYRRLGEYLVNRGQYNDAREVFEKGMESNPLHAPLYHSLAELEARVFNLDGLAKLNRRAAELFNNNAMEPTKSSSRAYGAKIRAKREQILPSGINALAEKIVDEDEDGLLLDTIDKIDPSKTLEALNASMLEDDFIGGMVSHIDFDRKT